ncbi:hypothetical protein [Rhodococcus sp. PD04]|uniref:hypothetical protein n=1 Tax=Rhodococcus sp. PD04 TaxID=3109594 RepID=UPI002DDC7806|nr:hypothetical protein [Rhodococcus sp. PD04]WSE22332.1 hypothetical protein U9J23_22200 [Rhodococcus sp. PD04]
MHAIDHEHTQQHETATVEPLLILGAGVGVGTGGESAPAGDGGDGGDPNPAGGDGDPKPGDGGEGEPKPKPTETLEFWKAKAREQERRAKANAEAAQKFAELEEAKKSDEQKAAERLAKAEQRAAEVELRADRAEVAAATGVPVEILAGPEENTADAIKAYAEKVLEFAKAQAGTARIPNGVVIPNEGKQPGDVSLDEQIAAATKAGNHRLAISLKRQKARQG